MWYGYFLKFKISVLKMEEEHYGKNIIVKDYPYEGSYIFGTLDSVNDDGTNRYLLDDGDIYSEKDLKDSDYEYILISSDDIINQFKNRFRNV